MLHQREVVHRSESSSFLQQSACMRLCNSSQGAPCPLLLILTRILWVFTLYAHGKSLPLTLWKKEIPLQQDRDEEMSALSHCRKQEEQGEDSRSPKPPTCSQEATGLLQD